MTEVECRPAAGAEDAAFLYTLFEDLRRDEFAPLGMPASALEPLLRMQHRAQTTGYRAQFPHADDQIVWHAGERIGRLLVDTGPQAVYVVDIALLRGFRGAGIGTALLRGVCERARGLHLPVRLSVRAGNPAARLYARLGFAAMGVHDSGSPDVAMSWRG